MAMYDWNHNGKDDMGDNFIEYQIYKDVTGQHDKSSYTPSRGGGLSTFGAILSVLAGLVGQVMIHMALNIEVDNVPVIVMVILWIIISSVAAAVLDNLGI